MKKIIFGGLAIIGLMFLTSGGGRLLENQPAFCNSCHEMNRPHAGWLSSGADQSHPNCMICHSGAGVRGVVEAQMRGLVQLVEHFTMNENELKGPFTAKVPKEFCLKCHNFQLPRVVKAHRRLKTEGRTCSDCHKHREGWEFSGEIRKEL